MHWKKPLLVTDKFLRLFVNTFPADDKHYKHNRDNLAQPIQMQLYQKQKPFLNFFLAFPKSTLNFKHMPKKDFPEFFFAFLKSILNFKQFPKNDYAHHS